MRTGKKLFLCSLFLLLALLLTGFTATGTIRAYVVFQQDHQQIQQGDAHTVKGWMTISYVSHMYHVPEPCFVQNLHVHDHWLVEHAPLRALADFSRQSLEHFLHQVANVIIAYRQQLACAPPPSDTPTPIPTQEVLHQSSENGGQL